MKFQDFVSRQTWIFAKTFTDKAPHEYIVREKVGNDEEFNAAVMYIRKYGFKAKFWGKEHIYLPIDGYFYWTMGIPVEETIIINRCHQNKYEVEMKLK